MEGWAIKWSSDFVNEYPQRTENGVLSDGSPENPNHLLGSFLCLFPYGMGGYKVNRPTPVSYEAHARWSLHYNDKCFRKDHHFMFQLFGVLQKRQLCAAAALQISKTCFSRHEHGIRSLTPSDFELASAEERAHKPFSNPVMHALRQNLSSVRTKVMGTDESRIKIRSLIWGMCIKKNPPSIWLTINPADTQDPIAQVLCGEDIDLDNFTARDHRPSDTAIAADPYAAFLFFQLVVNAILDSLLGIKGIQHNHQIERETGILGNIEAFIGTVEAQGRGTLHLHMLLWLTGTLLSLIMKERLLNSDFRNNIRQFITANIRAHLPGTEGVSTLSIPHERTVAFSRPVDPRLPYYEEHSTDTEKRIARTVQVHQCSQSCMKFSNRQLVCKRRAPFPLANEDWIGEDGQWGPKRTYGYLNNWCPAILQSIWANHDIKLITNGMETKDIAWYITHYVAKKQNDSTNISTLLVKTFAFHHAAKNQLTDLSAINKKLVQQCGNSLSHQQELSAPEVVAYLMGWGDCFISHHFQIIHWNSIVQLLKKTFPVLRQQW